MASPIFFYCTCNESDVQPHVHCQCEVCANAPVSRATAYRHFDRTNAVQTYAEARSDNDFLEEAGSPEESSQNTACTYSDQGIFEAECTLNFVASDDEGSHCGSEIHVTTEGTESDPSESEDHEPEITESVPATENNIFERIAEAVLDTLKLQLELKLSQVGLEKILDWGQKLFLITNSDRDNLWPKNWSECEKVLKNVGYEDAKQFVVCLDDSHRCLYGLMERSSQLCPHCGKPGSIPYYYIGLNSKLKLWCKDRDMCKKMTYHMKEKDHWFYENSSEDWGCEIKKEIWDGKRFSQLSWFWDADHNWTLPAFCPDQNCKYVISSSEVDNQPFIPGSRLKTLTCPSCHKIFTHEPEQAQGDPRNVAYILHWDGFQPFSGKENHGSGALEVQIATMCKEDRCKAEEVYVVGFIPCYLLPNRRPVSLDPFLHPLIEEIEIGFIEGVDVDYALETEWKDAGPAKLRHLILLCTADYPAMCELCKSKFCGKSPCRRCKCGSSRASEETNTYYYGDYHQAARFPWPKRLVEQNILQQVGEEERISVASTRSQEVGFTGLSILFRLNRLYGFDVQRDCVIDVMHTVSLGIIKNHLAFILNDENTDKTALQERLKKFPWNSYFRASRYPSNFNRTGFWKAEDFHKFAFPASELVLGGIISSEDYEVWETLPRIVEYLYQQGRNGWSLDSAMIFNDMCFRYNILLEDRYGLSSCHAVNHLVTHVHEDVLYFGSPDNYWCYDFERAVARYTAISNNHKNIELTFARAELRWEILKVRDSMTSKSTEDLQAEALFTQHCSSLSEMSSIVASIPVEERDESLPNFFVIGHWKEYTGMIEGREVRCYRFCLMKKGSQHLKSTCLPLHVSVAAFVLSKSVEKEESLLKLVTLLFVKALKMKWKC